ncbi:MAG: hypothetical protein Q9227_006802 [Pyrenula ochraceoflavens]
MAMNFVTFNQDYSHLAVVLAIRLNRKRLVIVLEDYIYLYDIQNMKLLSTIETSPNLAAICALSPSSDNCFLAYPLPQKANSASFAPPSHSPPSGTHVAPTTGDVLLFDAAKCENINVIEAHKSPLSSITINNEGTMLATASDKGTIIRVFSIPQGHKLYQFRRGSMPSRIFSMSFNLSSTLLCVSSATDTIHVFKLGPQSAIPDDRPVSAGGASNTSVFSERKASRGSESPPEASADLNDGETSPSLASRKHNGTFMGMLRRTSQNVGTSFATTVGGYLPKGVTEIWEPSRDFAWIKVPKAATASGSPSNSLRSVVAMSSNTPHVMVVTNEGNFYVYNIDLAKGGEGSLVKQYS